MRRLIAFPCEDETLLGTLDAADGATGLLIVSGGNEPRMGAHRGMALLAARLAARGTPVFRFDRRGVGDSGGANGGWVSSAPDLAAAAAAFRAAAPGLMRIVGFGNCDAATTLALFGAGAGVHDLILANPWVIERSNGLPPPAAIRARYAERLRSPREWLHFALHGVSLPKLFSGLSAILRKPSESELARGFADAVRQQNTTIILAERDGTAIAYVDAVKGMAIAARTIPIDTASHSFARQRDAEALFQAISAALGAPA